MKKIVLAAVLLCFMLVSCKTVTVAPGSSGVGDSLSDISDFTSSILVPSNNSTGEISASADQGNDSTVKAGGNINESGTCAESSLPAASKPESTVSEIVPSNTRIIKNDIFSIEVPVSLVGKFEEENMIRNWDESEASISLCIKDTAYFEVYAQITFFAVDIKNDFSKFNDPENGDYYKLIAQKDNRAVYVRTTEKLIEETDEGGLDNYNAVYAYKDAIISSFKWVS